LKRAGGCGKFNCAKKNTTPYTIHPDPGSSLCHPNTSQRGGRLRRRRAIRPGLAPPEKGKKENPLQPGPDLSGAQRP